MIFSKDRRKAWHCHPFADSKVSPNTRTSTNKQQPMLYSNTNLTFSKEGYTEHEHLLSVILLVLILAIFRNKNNLHKHFPKCPSEYVFLYTLGMVTNI